MACKMRRWTLPRLEGAYIKKKTATVLVCNREAQGPGGKYPAIEYGLRAQGVTLSEIGRDFYIFKCV